MIRPFASFGRGVAPFFAAMAIILGAYASAPAAATTAPSERSSSVESTPLRRGLATNSPTTRSAGSDKTGSTLDLFRVISALVIVLAIIFVLKWASKRFLGIQTPGGSSGAIRILSRQIVSPRQQLMLVQVGQRILLVANCGAQMTSLCEMSEADEVASLLAQIKSTSASPVGKPFSSLFRRAEAEYEPDESTGSGKEKPDAELASTKEELGGLLNKVKAISRSFRKA